MAVKTRWTVQFTCGHAEVKDLSHKPVHERAGYAGWMARKQTCGDCFRASSGGDREQWLAKQREQEAADAAEWAETYRMPELSGSEKQVSFAARVRYQLMRDLHEWVVEGGHADPEVYERAEEHARRVDQARWWLDNKDQGEDEPTDQPTLIELLASAAEHGDGIACENPA